ncbi:FAD-dependent oxidoreductase [Brucepastera parasyntrophica]|uniref:FAD-dependent oxidoreductase n=1 Tax=Brucepastera parasyntrophica TaxID=2880008 RepID=UPI00210A2EDE|nr:FAD-dependent oxidoreductase [Brucepastera parasyntrophica]
MAEQLRKLDIDVTLVQWHPHILYQMDEDMILPVQYELEQHGVHLKLATEVTGFQRGPGNNIHILETAGGEKLEADMVLLAAGVRPNTELTVGTGIKTGVTGAVKVDAYMRTTVPDIYAAGDVAESFSVITGKAVYRPLGTTANKTGRIAGDAVTGGGLKHRGVLGTAIVRVFGITVAFTGLNEREAADHGYDCISKRDTYPDHAPYLGGENMVVKIIADKKSGLVLGAQITGRAGVDKRIDVLATAITYRARVEDLFHLDLAYSPPYSIVKDPIQYVGMAMEKQIQGKNS